MSKLLNEQNYQNAKRKISITALVVLVIGILGGISLVTVGILNMRKINIQYSEENISKQLSEKTALLNEENEKLDRKLEELLEEIAPTEERIKALERVSFDGFTDEYYEREDEIERLTEYIAPIKEDINDIKSYKSNGFCTNIDILKTACKLESEIRDLENINIDFEKKFHSSEYIPFFIGGVFVIIASLMISGTIYMIAKRREMMAFSVQQMMPVAQETIEEITPTIAKAGKTIASEMKDVYGDIAESITRGIKDGLSDKEKQNDE